MVCSASKKRGRIALFLLFCAQWRLINAIEEQSCLSSLNQIHKSEEAVVDASKVRKYILCPNTEFKVAEKFDPFDDPVDGDRPIVIARQNVHISCGEDGKHENNCILTSGLVQLAFIDQYMTTSPATNGVVEGLTFTGSYGTSLNVLANHEGDLVMRDCVFTNNKNTGIIHVESPAMDTRRRHRTLTAIDTFPSLTQLRSLFVLQRKSQQLTSRLNVSLEGCLFKDNTIGSIPGKPTGLLYSSGAALTVTNTTFVSTENEATDSKIQYLVGLLNSNVVLTNNCFIENDVTVAPVVNQDSMVDSLDSNYGERTNIHGPSYVCDFMASVEKGDMLESGFDSLTFSCIDFDSDVCMSATKPSLGDPKNADSKCLLSLNDIYIGEREVRDDTVLRKYVLCPNTTFEIASEFDEDGFPLNGDKPIVIGRPNTYIFCGEDGLSENSCILSGGLIQLAVFDEYGWGRSFPSYHLKSSPPATNAIVRGLTFDSASVVNVMANFHGDVMFRDCAFKNNANAGAILTQDPNDSETRGRRLSSILRKDGTNFDNGEFALDRIFSRRTNSHRDMEQGDLRLSVAGCYFENNFVTDASSQLRSEGVISNFGAVMIIRDTIFEANGQTDMRLLETDYMVGNIDGDMTLIGNCFQNNNHVLAPVVNQYGVCQEMLNSVSDNSPSLCDFVYDVKEGDVSASPVKDLRYQCYETENEVCKLIPTASPTAAPSIVPTTAPSVAPTLRPTQTPTKTPTKTPTDTPTPIPSPMPSSQRVINAPTVLSTLQPSPKINGSPPVPFTPDPSAGGPPPEVPGIANGAQTASNLRSKAATLRSTTITCMYLSLGCLVLLFW